MIKKVNATYFFLSLMIFFSCSNDDDENVIDPIVGEWKLNERIENGSTLTISNCEVNDRIEFLNEGTIIDRFFEPDTNGNQCREIIDDSGSWEKTSESEYRIIIDDGDVNYVATVVFSQNNTVQVQEYTLNDGSESFTLIDTYEKTK
ncbi:lipocalin-like domain-containing protein [Aquimarina algicola]|uniref:Lipocalin-like domain-containing protein n=1 Tax=Aquimarina algicola TaxID=2589995 RepID=A0A504JHI7_9FLAO|nr:lipocalin family protein [Aquimarina algicola]TPN86259.1 hypothetical protein FHK87_13410 [Aquimarina algicola]